MGHSLPSRRARRGFTLVEVLVALALLLGVSTALWRTMSLTFGTKTRLEAINGRYHEARQVMLRMMREFRMAYLRDPLTEEERLGQEPRVVTRFVGSEDEVYFATTAHLAIYQDARESDQAEVGYVLKSSDRDSTYERGKTLYRRESTRVDDRPDRGGKVWALLDGVKEFKLEYWDERHEIGGEAWRRDWDSDENQALPRIVRITLVLEAPDGGPDLRFMTQAAPKVRTPINPLR